MILCFGDMDCVVVVALLRLVEWFPAGDLALDCYFSKWKTVDSSTPSLCSNSGRIRTDRPISYN